MTIASASAASFFCRFTNGRILRRDQLDCIAQLDQLARSVIGAAAGFHDDKRRWLL
jgi:hypothetical protein